MCQAGDDSIPQQLGAVTEVKAISVGQALALTILSCTTAELAVDEWILGHDVLVDLDKAEPTFFRPFLTIIAKNLIERSAFGMKLRVAIGAFISILDMISDIVMIVNYFQRGLKKAAISTSLIIAVSTTVQLFIVHAQNAKQKRLVLLKESLLVLSCLTYRNGPSCSLCPTARPRPTTALVSPKAQDH